MVQKRVIICYFCFVLCTLEKKLWLGGNIPIKVMIDYQDEKLFRLCIYMTCLLRHSQLFITDKSNCFVCSMFV